MKDNAGQPLPKVARCPCCGSAGALNTLKTGKSTIRTPFWRGVVRCSNTNCGITTPLTRAPAAAIRIWNRRGPEPQP